METSRTAANRLVQNPPSTQPPQISDYDSWKPGRGRPRKDGRPNKSAVRLPAVRNVVNQNLALPVPVEHRGSQKTMNSIAPRVRSNPVRVNTDVSSPYSLRGGRAEEVVWTPQFKALLRDWDPHTSAERIARIYNITPQCARRWAQIAGGVWYRDKDAQRPQEATRQPSQVAEDEDDYDDPFGMGVSLGWHRDEDGGNDNPNPFSFSRADKKPINPFPSSPLATCVDHLHIHAERCLVICDLHTPAHDPALLFAACKFASKRMGARTVILGGDFLDMTSLSSYTQTGDRRRLMDDVDLLRKILDIMRSQFSLEPVCILGNHEQRWNRLMGPDVSVDEFLRLAFADVQVSRFEWCSLTSGGQEWHIDHGTGGSNPVLHGNRLAARLHKNVVLGHMHKSHDTRDYSGRFQILASGTCCDPTRIRYISERIQASAWVQGVTVIQDGFGRVLGPQSPELRDT